MNKYEINGYVILLLIDKFFPKSVFQVQQLFMLWEERILPVLSQNTLKTELLVRDDGNPVWKTRIVKAISELLNMEYINRAYPYSMQYQRYAITDFGKNVIAAPSQGIKEKLSGNELFLSREIEEVIKNIHIK
mgnify:CR=1 FL=1|tara:strand:+ start:12092 stop:12490 length:399 start_codon:yes stop_codon:yes gene_type:complete